MSSGGATTTKGGPVKGGVQQQNPSTNNNNSKKSSKSDSKSDKLDLTPKIVIVATAEQMQIAKIMDSHRVEDPELQKKIRQVMEITRTTEDQACMALHSREYDIEMAITLLTDGGSQSLESEWAQAGKKRKVKTPNQKSDTAVVPKDGKGGVIKDGERTGRDKSDKRDLKGEKKDLEGGGDQPFTGDQRRGDRAGRSGIGTRSRGGRPGIGRGGRSDKENEELMKSGRMGGMTNGPGRGGRGGGGISGGNGRGSRGGGRTFASRARGDRDGDSYNTIDVWENTDYQADGTKEAPMKVDKWGEFPSAEDWDNEEYTGSLADTKVFTPSTQTTVGPLNDTTNGSGSGHPNSNHIQSASSNSSADILKMAANQESGVTMSSVVQGLAGSGANGGNQQSGSHTLDLNLLLSKQNSTVSSGVSSHANPGVNLLASLQSSSYSNSNQMNVGVSNQALPPRNKVQRPRGPPSKIPSSAVEMPDDPGSTLDVQFGGLDLSSSDPSLSFSSVMQGGKQDNTLIYGGQGTKMDSFGSGNSNDKDLKSSGHSPSPFQTSINAQSSLTDPGKGSNLTGTSNTPGGGIDNLSLSQNQTKSQQPGSNSYAAANSGNNAGSAFVSYAHAGNKPAPGFPAPGFPPVSQNTYSSTAATGGPVYGSQQQIPNQQSGYMSHIAYGTASNTSSQPIVASSQNANVPYGPGSTAPPQSGYHMNSNVNSGYNNSSGNTQYASYGPKMGGLNTTTGIKESTTDVSANVMPASSVGSVATSQMGSNVQPGSAGNTSSTSSNAKSSSVPATTNTTSKMMPPGMVMPPYILSQNTPAVPFYGVQTQVYGYEDNSMQFMPRLPPNFGYYDATGPGGYGVQVSGRNDAQTMQAYSNAADGRFQRSDSSTASPVPSNLAGGNTQQAMYNQAMPYFYVGNNMVQGSFPYTHMYQQPMAPATNPSGPAVNHQYQNKSVYNASYAYDTNQGGPTNDFNNKGSYPSGPNSNSTKGSTTGVSQSTDLNSSIYKGHMGKINSYDKQFGPGGQGGFSSGAQPNVLNNLSNAMATSYSVFIPSQAVHTLPPMHQDAGGNASRPGPGQPKGKQQQQYSGGPYWGNN
ncbi:protein lingerer isoform X3 [Folsomia candida]|uniref:protein lingerer isoform X3 n=1 Tax=Folsomia candida TaxID=158441 RepID=UPI000B902F1C|nr:protein lingerer isoform X3 [Folsomia candida]